MNPKRLFVPPLTLLALLWLPGTVLGALALNTFQPVAHQGPDGRTVVVHAVLGCTEGELYQLRVRLNQRSTATLASGRAHGFCTGEREAFTVRLRVLPGHGRLEPGDVRAVGLVTTRDLDGREVTDAHQWQKDLQIE
ncbi:MAG: hypothetical protein ACOC7L_03520 [Acidobacteriota bacterium]